jgi:hypothetical protein
MNNFILYLAHWTGTCQFDQTPLGHTFFISWITNLPTQNLCEGGNKNQKMCFFFLFY